MFLIPFGLIFIFYSYDLVLTDMTALGFWRDTLAIDLINDLVGYLLIGINAWKLRSKSFSFSRALWLCAAMSLFYVATRLWSPTGLFGLACLAIETAGVLWLLKLLVDGVQDLESIEKRHLNYVQLHRWQYLVSITWLAVFACTVGVNFISGLGFFSLLIVFIWAVLALLLIITFLRTAMRYRKMGEEREKAEWRKKGSKKFFRGPLPLHIDK